MARFGFVGPSYTSQSPFLNAERSVNWYVENEESGEGKSAGALYPTPGLTTAYSGSETAVTSLLAVNGRLFGITHSGVTVYLKEYVSGGGVNTIQSWSGQGVWNANLSSLTAGNNYLFAICGNIAFAYKLSNGAVARVDTLLAQANPVMGAFLDGYYVVLFANSNEFQISALEDPTTWNGVDVAQVSVFPENCVAMLVDHREMWMFGGGHTQVYYNSGASDFPISVIPGAFVEQGCSAAKSPVRMDNSVFWLGADERGQGVAWRANGYVPLRVSNFAVEYAWSQYSTISDAIGYSYQDQGHTFWVLYFPTANATWVYDAATGEWHERQSYANGVYGAHLSQCHAFAFGKHLVGDWNSGNIYAMSIDSYNENGVAIQRIRRAPWVSTEQEWMFHQRLQVDAEVALASGSDNPQVTLQWSDDGTKTWSNQHQASAGMAGQTFTRVIWRRLGRSRGRIYEISVTDSIPWRIVDAYLEAQPGFQKVQRLSKYFGQMK
jgi:hypothetical protein